MPFPITGTLINTATVIVGGAAGAFLGNRLPEKMRQTVLSGIGLMTLVLGMTMAMQTKNALIPLFSVLLGGVIGEALRIEDGLERLGRWFEAKLGRRSHASAAGIGRATITQGFITASLVFCVGPMTILGAIQDGLMGDFTLLTIKATLDGFTGMALAASLGAGVILSALTVFGFQASLSLLALISGAALGGVTRETLWVVEMTATGGVVILSIGFLLLDIKRIRVANLLPAVFVAPALVLALGRLGL